MNREGAETIVTDALDQEGVATHGVPATGEAPASEIRAEAGMWGRAHPIGYVAAALLVVAGLFHSVLDTKYLIGNFDWWHWAGLVALLVLSVLPDVLHGIRLFIEGIASVSKTIAWVLAWVVFLVQLFNVITRYGNDLVDQDILIGEATSLAWQTFGLMFLIGINYGVRDDVNPRIDFWWADFRPKTKAWLDFTLHVLLLFPFIWMVVRILQPYASTSLGQRRDGTWPSGWRVWNTWEESPDADQLPVGPIKAMLLVAFVLFGVQIIAELIKTGFVMIGRDDYGAIAEHDAPARIE